MGASIERGQHRGEKGRIGMNANTDVSGAFFMKIFGNPQKAAEPRNITT